MEQIETTNNFEAQINVPNVEGDSVLKPADIPKVKSVVKEPVVKEPVVKEPVKVKNIFESMRGKAYEEDIPLSEYWMFQKNKDDFDDDEVAMLYTSAFDGIDTLKPVNKEDASYLILNHESIPGMTRGRLEYAKSVYYDTVHKESILEVFNDPSAVDYRLGVDTTSIEDKDKRLVFQQKTALTEFILNNNDKSLRDIQSKGRKYVFDNIQSIMNNAFDVNADVGELYDATSDLLGGEGSDWSVQYGQIFNRASSNYSSNGSIANALASGDTKKADELFKQEEGKFKLTVGNDGIAGEFASTMTNSLLFIGHSAFDTNVLDKVALGGVIGGSWGMTGGALAPATATAGAVMGAMNGWRVGFTHNAYSQYRAESYVSMRKEGINSELASKISNGAGIVMALVENIGMAHEIGIGKIASGFVKEFGEGALLTMGKEGVEKSFKDYIKKKGVIDAVLTFAKESGKEGIEESLQSTTGTLAKKLGHSIEKNPNQDVIDNINDMLNADWTDAEEMELIKGTLFGMAGGGMFHSIGVVNQKTVEAFGHGAKNKANTEFSSRRSKETAKMVEEVARLDKQKESGTQDNTGNEATIDISQDKKYLKSRIAFERSFSNVEISDYYGTIEGISAKASHESGLKDVKAMSKDELKTELGIEGKSLSHSWLVESVNENRKKGIMPKKFVDKFIEGMINVTRVEHNIDSVASEMKARDMVKNAVNKRKNGETMTPVDVVVLNNLKEAGTTIDKNGNISGFSNPKDMIQVVEAEIKKGLTDDLSKLDEKGLEIVTGITGTKEEMIAYQVAKIDNIKEVDSTTNAILKWMHSQNSDVNIVQTNYSASLGSLIELGQMSEKQAKQLLIDSGSNIEEQNITRKVLNSIKVKALNIDNQIIAYHGHDFSSLIEEMSETAYKSLMETDVLWNDKIRDERINWEKFLAVSIPNQNGNKKAKYEALLKRSQSGQSNIEWASDRAVEWNLEVDPISNKLGMAFKAFMKAIQGLKNYVAGRGVALRQYHKEGNLSKEMVDFLSTFKQRESVSNDKITTQLGNVDFETYGDYIERTGQDALIDESEQAYQYELDSRADELIQAMEATENAEKLSKYLNKDETMALSDPLPQDDKKFMKETQDSLDTAEEKLKLLNTLDESKNIDDVVSTLSKREATENEAWNKIYEQNPVIDFLFTGGKHKKVYIDGRYEYNPRFKFLTNKKGGGPPIDTFTLEFNDYVDAYYSEQDVVDMLESAGSKSKLKSNVSKKQLSNENEAFNKAAIDQLLIEADNIRNELENMIGEMDVSDEAYISEIKNLSEQLYLYTEGNDDGLKGLKREHKVLKRSAIEREADKRVITDKTELLKKARKTIAELKKEANKQYKTKTLELVANQLIRELKRDTKKDLRLTEKVLNRLKASTEREIFELKGKLNATAAQYRVMRNAYFSELTRRRRRDNLIEKTQRHKGNVSAKLNYLFELTKDWIPQSTHQSRIIAKAIDKMHSLKTERGFKNYEKAFNKTVDKIIGLVDEYERQQYHKKIKDNFDKSKVKDGKGKLTPEIQDQIDEMRRIYKLNGEAWTKELYEAIDGNNDSKVSDLYAYNTTLGNKRMSHVQLSQLLMHQRSLIEDGVNLNKIKKIAQKDVEAKLIELTMETIKGTLNGGVDLGARSDIVKKISAGFGWAHNLRSIFEFLDNVKTNDLFSGKMVQFFSKTINRMSNKHSKGLRQKNDIVNQMITDSIGSSARSLNDGKRIVKDTNIIIDGIEIPMSPFVAISIRNWWLNESTRKSLEGQGFDESSIEQVDRFLENAHTDKKAYHKLADSILEFYRVYYNEVNSVFKRVNDINLTQEDYYTPAIKSVENSAIVDDKIELYDDNVDRVFAAALLDRTGDTSPMDLENGDTMKILSRHIQTMEGWMAKTEGMTQFRHVLQNKDVKALIKERLGNETNVIIAKNLNKFEMEDLKDAVRVPVIDKMISGFIRSKIAGNIKTFIKQLSSTMAYTVEMPIKNWITETASLLKNPSELKSVMDEISKSELITDRYDHSSFNDALRHLDKADGYLDATGKSVTRSIDKYLMIPTKLGDKIAIYAGGASYYAYKKNEYMTNDKMSESDAKKMAIEDFEVATSFMQQSGKAKDLSTFQQGGTFTKIFSMFMNSQFGYMRMGLSAISNQLQGKGSIAQNTKALVVSQLALPWAFALGGYINYMIYEALTGEDDEKRRQEKYDLIKYAPMFGSPIPFFRDALATAGYSLSGYQTPMYIGNQTIASDMVRAVEKINKGMRTNDDKKVYQGFRTFTELGTGIPIKRLEDSVDDSRKIIDNVYGKK